MVAHALAMLGKLDQVGPIFRLAGLGDQLLQRLALSGVVIGVKGALHQQLQRRVARAMPTLLLMYLMQPALLPDR